MYTYIYIYIYIYDIIVYYILYYMLCYIILRYLILYIILLRLRRAPAETGRGLPPSPTTAPTRPSSAGSWPPHAQLALGRHGGLWGRQHAQWRGHRLNGPGRGAGQRCERNRVPAHRGGGAGGDDDRDARHAAVGGQHLRRDLRGAPPGAARRAAPAPLRGHQGGRGAARRAGFRRGLRRTPPGQGTDAAEQTEREPRRPGRGGPRPVAGHAAAAAEGLPWSQPGAAPLAHLRGGDRALERQIGDGGPRVPAAVVLHQQLPAALGSQQ